MLLFTRSLLMQLSTPNSKNPSNFNQIKAKSLQSTKKIKISARRAKIKDKFQLSNNLHKLISTINSQLVKFFQENMWTDPIFKTYLRSFTWTKTRSRWWRHSTKNTTVSNSPVFVIHSKTTLYCSPMRGHKTPSKG